MRRLLSDSQARYLGKDINKKQKGKNLARYHISNKEYRHVMSKTIRLSDFTAKLIGVEPDKSMRYVLTDEQFKKYSELGQAPIKRLFFDIETSPEILYNWRSGYLKNTYIPYSNVIQDWKIITISYSWEGENEVHNLFWEKGCDKKLVSDFVKVLNEADEIVAHNGDRFDIKKIRTRAIYHRIPMMPKYRSLDTLKKARSYFSFDSNKLDDLADFLGVGAKVKHEGFEMWTKVMAGDKKAEKSMIKYCNGDIVVLEDVFFVMQHYFKPNTHAGVINGELKSSCPICASKNPKLLKNDVTEKGTLSRVMECQDCGHTYNISNSAWRNYLEIAHYKK